MWGEMGMVGGGISSFFRWICHIPTGMAGFQALNLLDTGLQKGLAETSQGRDLLIGLQLLQYVGITTFAWNFVMFLGSYACVGFGLGIVGIIDVVLASLLAAGVAKVSSHLPGSSFSCTPDNKPSGNPAHTGDFCRSLFQEKVVVIIVIVIYFICGLINLIVGWSWVPGVIDIHGLYPSNFFASVGDTYGVVRKRVYGLELWSWRPSFEWAYKIKHGVMGWVLVDGEDDDTVVNDDDSDKEALLGEVELTTIITDEESKS